MLKLFNEDLQKEMCFRKHGIDRISYVQGMQIFFYLKKTDDLKKKTKKRSWHFYKI